MKLLRLHIENFGTLQNFRLELSEGLNLLHEENGWGKSTLAAFIKAMLYGLPATTKRSLDENERKKYLPWQGGAFGGSVELETQKGTFRIERFFDVKESGDTFSLYDCASNQLSDAYSERIGEELFGIDAEGFERTVFLSQRVQSFKGENNSITARLGNLLDDVDDIASFDEAVAALEKRRKFYTLTGNRGRIAELEQERFQAQDDLASLERIGSVLADRERELHALEEELQAMEAEQDALRAEHRRAAEYREKRVLRDQKTRMCNEIDILKRKKAEVENRLQGVPPSKEELERQKRLLERIRSARAEMNAIQNATPAQEELTLLPFGMNSRVPEEELLSRLRTENTVLQNICHREEGLQRIQRESCAKGADQGYPDAKVTDEMMASLKEAERLKTELDGCGTAPERKASGSVLLSVAFFVACVVLFTLSVLPSFFSVRTVLTVAAGISLAIGSFIGLIAFKKAAKHRRIAEEYSAKCTDLTARRERILQRVAATLATYGVSSPEGDLMRGAIALSLKAEEARMYAERNRGATEELAGLIHQKEKVLAFLQSNFRSFGIHLPPKNDYRDEIESLSRDAERILRVRKEKATRESRLESAQAEWKALCEQMRPFLQTYDPTHRMSAQECLQIVMEDSVSYEHLSEELHEKNARLQAFLDQNAWLRSTEAEVAFDEKELTEKDNDLRLRMRTKQEAYAALQQRIERMHAETERIPECRARLSQLSEALDEARANSATIANTQKLLEEAKVGLSTRYLADMQTSFSTFLKVVCPQEAPQSVMNTSFEVLLRKEGKTRSMESFSRGWRDVVQFCLRLSLAEALYKEGELPFLLLDDPFVNLDDYRLSAAKQLLVTLSRRYQILYMVCHADRA